MNSVFLVGFFRFDDRGPEYGFKRMHLHHVWKTMEEAREQMSFCDEAGWYQGAVIEERHFGHAWPKEHNRVWLLQQEGGEMKQIEEPEFYKCVMYIVG